MSKLRPFSPSPRVILECPELSYTLTSRSLSMVTVKLPDGTEYFRHTDCPAYDECLGLAVIRKWKNWSCDGCQECSKHLAEIDNAKTKRRGGKAS